jgi:transcriptional regulator GlxA family with amidase domain
VDTVVGWGEFYSGLNREWGQRFAAPVDQRLERARRFIEQHFAEPIDLDRMTRTACLSRFHFQREFKRAFGVTPRHHLTRARVERARELLENTDQPVTSLCFDFALAASADYVILV